MDPAQAVSIISNLGFPIAVCCFLGYYYVKSEQAHKDEIDKLSGVIEHNTLAVQHMADAINSNKAVNVNETK